MTIDMTLAGQLGLQTLASIKTALQAAQNAAMQSQFMAHSAMSAVKAANHSLDELQSLGPEDIGNHHVRYITAGVTPDTDLVPQGVPSVYPVSHGYAVIPPPKTLDLPAAKTLSFEPPHAPHPQFVRQAVLPLKKEEVLSQLQKLQQQLQASQEEDHNLPYGPSTRPQTPEERGCPTLPWWLRERDVKRKTQRSFF